MTDEYILERLKKWVPLFYGKDKEEFAFSYTDTIKLETNVFQKSYLFGYDNENGDFVLNTLTKPLAIYLITGLFEFKKFLEKEGVDTNNIPEFYPYNYENLSVKTGKGWKVPNKNDLKHIKRVRTK